MSMVDDRSSGSISITEVNGLDRAPRHREPPGDRNLRAGDTGVVPRKRVASRSATALVALVEYCR